MSLEICELSPGRREGRGGVEGERSAGDRDVEVLCENQAEPAEPGADGEYDMANDAREIATGDAARATKVRLTPPSLFFLLCHWVSVQIPSFS